MPKRLILVSYRLPVRFAVTKGRLQAKKSPGGLASALRSLVEGDTSARSTVWAGIGDLREENFRRAADEPGSDKVPANLVPIFLSTQERDLFYNGFCNSVLWPLFHYFPSYVVYDESYFAAYKHANQAVADKIAADHQEGDVIWIHDYHFMLLPGLLRQRLPRAVIGFFLHIPFPSFELFRILPRHWQREVLTGLMGADVVGFHTVDYARHFLASLRQTLDVGPSPDGVSYEGRIVKVKEFPISIDVEKFHRLASTASIRKEVSKIRERFRNTKIILSVDRLDYTKAIINRLESFEWFLKEHPEFREKATYILLLVPTRDTIPKYRENKLQVETLIGRINGLYGTLMWTPIIYQHRSLELEKLVALYSASHIALITPLRDGMNLVAKEFVASRPDTDGVLVLSDTAGCAVELPQAIIVNPNDRHEIAGALVKAMLLPKEEQSLRMQQMQAQLRSHDVHQWVSEFVDCLDPSTAL